MCDEDQQIRNAIDWLGQLNLDFLEIETGFRVYSPGRPTYGLDELATQYGRDKYNMETYIKVTFPPVRLRKTLSPTTGEPLWQLPPHYADPDSVSWPTRCRCIAFKIPSQPMVKTFPIS